MQALIQMRTWRLPFRVAQLTAFTVSPKHSRFCTRSTRLFASFTDLSKAMMLLATCIALSFQPDSCIGLHEVVTKAEKEQACNWYMMRLSRRRTVCVCDMQASDK